MQKQQSSEPSPIQVPEEPNHDSSKVVIEPKQLLYSMERELFEETNLLYSRRDPDADKGTNFEEPLLSNYN